MRPGMFRDLADIERTSEAAGDPVPNYSGTDLYRDVPCDITMVQGSETFRGRGIEALATHVVELQYLPDITPLMRLRVRHGIHAGRILNIRAVRNVDMDRGRVRKLALDCAEVIDV